MRKDSQMHQTISATGQPQRQRGATLVVALIILVVLTLLGVTAMQGATMQERMAGNARDVNVAFQAAEAALRDGEGFLANTVVLPAFNGDLGLYRAPDVGDPRPWEIGGFDWGNDNDARQYEDDDFGGAEAPAYVIEELQVTPQSEGGEIGLGLPTPAERLYRVTARGVGGNPNTIVILQTVFKRQ